MSTFFREIVKLPDQELEPQRSLAVWNARLASAHTIPPEMTFGEQCKLASDRFRDLNVPTLLLLGGSSPAFLKEALNSSINHC